MTAAPGLSSAPPIAGIIARAREQGRDALSEPEAKSVLEAFGIATPRRVVIRDADHHPHLGDLRPPYVVKVVSPTILHKSDVGGVTVGLPDAAAVISAIATMRNRITAAGHIAEAWLVEEMAPARRGGRRRRPARCALRPRADVRPWWRARGTAS